MAQAGEVGHAGRAPFGEGSHVVDLQPVPRVAPGYDAHRVTFGQGPPEGDGDGPARVGHGGDVHAVGDEHVEHRVDGESTGDLDRNGSHAVDLAQFAPFHVPAHQGGVVDPHVHGGHRSTHSGRPGRPCGIGRVAVRPTGGTPGRPGAGQRHEGIGGERLAGLVQSDLPG